MSGGLLAWALLALAIAAEARKKGVDTICVGPRAHHVVYDIDGETLDTVENAVIAVHPASESDSLCGGASPHGDKAICVGANVDNSCTKAEKDKPLNDAFDCTNCFAGATTDFFYGLNISAFRVKGVEVGLRQSHLRGAIEIHDHERGAKSLVNGTVTLLSEDHNVGIRFTVAGIIPVDITIGMPTDLTYSVGVKASDDSVAGADVDVHLGDHFIRWTRQDGFKTVKGTPHVTVTPRLDIAAKAEMDLNVGLRSSLQVDVDKVLWYHVNLVPSLPIAIALSDDDQQVCATGGADFLVAHEADLHVKLFGKDHDFAHFGPKQLYHYHKDKVFNKCVNIPIPQEQSDIVV